ASIKANHEDASAVAWAAASGDTPDSDGAMDGALSGVRAAAGFEPAQLVWLASANAPIAKASRPAAVVFALPMRATLTIPTPEQHPAGGLRRASLLERADDVVEPSFRLTALFSRVADHGEVPGRRSRLPGFIHVGERVRKCIASSGLVVGQD